MFGLHNHASTPTPALLNGEIVVRVKLTRGLSGVLFCNGPGRYDFGASINTGEPVFAADSEGGP